VGIVVLVVAGTAWGGYEAGFYGPNSCDGRTRQVGAGLVRLLRDPVADAVQRGVSDNGKCTEDPRELTVTYVGPVASAELTAEYRRRAAALGFREMGAGCFQGRAGGQQVTIEIEPGAQAGEGMLSGYLVRADFYPDSRSLLGMGGDDPIACG
jgi:hypothetical protein